MALFRGLPRSALRKYLLSSGNDKVCFSAVRFGGHWNKDWKPGPYPKTEEERRAAAKKYNLIPEDYKPYDNEDGMGYNDYPELPRKSVEGRDPYYNWDITHLRRNYGEPVHVDADFMTGDRWSPDVKLPYSYTRMLLSFFGAVGGLIFIMNIGPVDGLERDLKPKQLWSPGVAHYTFNVEGSEESHH